MITAREDLEELHAVMTRDAERYLEQALRTGDLCAMAKNIGAHAACVKATLYVQELLKRYDRRVTAREVSE